MSRAEFLYQTASQRLWFDAPQGRPSATPSVEIRDKGGAVVSTDATTNVTQEGPSTTFDDAAGPDESDPFLLPLTATTSIVVGQHYVITNALGQSERVRVTKITSGASVSVGEKLQYTYAAADAFESTRWYYTLQAADYNTLRDSMVATTTYAVGGLNYSQRVLFDICRVVLSNPLTRELISARWPDLSSQEYGEQIGEDFQRQREQAWNSVKRGLRSAGRRPSLIVSHEDLICWALVKFEDILERSGVSVIRKVDKQDALEDIDRRLALEREQALASLQWYDVEDDRALGDETDHMPLRLDLAR